MFFQSIHYFRAIAIFLVVLSHCNSIGRWEPTTFADSFIFALVRNVTVYFVFIAGFLFHHIYIAKRPFNYRKFLTKRLLFVALPYGILAGSASLYSVLTGDWPPHTPEGLGSWPMVLFAWFMATGRVFVAYWYIPMAILIYLSSPLWIALARSRYIIPILGVGLAISSFIHRPDDDLNPLHALVYFAPIYLLGMTVSTHRDLVFRAIVRYRWGLLAAGLLLGIAQVMWLGSGNSFVKDLDEIFVFQGIDINLFQKIFLCLFLLSILQTLEQTKIQWLSLVADTSFPIYFIHPLLLTLSNQPFFYGRVQNLLAALHLQGHLPGILAIAVALTAASMAIALGLKQLLGDRSRYLIGW